MQNCYFPTEEREEGEGREEEAAAEKGSKRKEQRSDGRGAFDLRQVFMETGVTAGATGSAYLELNHTKVICAVYGPRADRRGGGAFSEEGQLRCDVRFAPFAQGGQRRDSKGFDDDEREMSALLRQTLSASVQLQRLTKMMVDIYVIILQSDGGELGAATTCASLALASAGIELFDLVAACSVGSMGGTENEGEEDVLVMMDPNREEERAGSGTMTVAMMPSTREVTQWWLRGGMSSSTVSRAVELCTDGIASMHAMMRVKLIAQATAQAKAKAQAQT